jgi:hypothetical protein
MLELCFLLPSLINCALGNETDQRLARDIIVLCVVQFLFKNQIRFPKYCYVALGMYGIVCEILNNVSYRILPPRKELKKQWAEILRYQTIKNLMNEEFSQNSSILFNHNHMFNYDDLGLESKTKTS